ncbi:DUF6932 family protein [Actinomadura graeca]|uniref:DUF6932 family protein n=1 Tax=Actinomadura graeca TaxID=2750812 RepID=UPI003B831097
MTIPDFDPQTGYLPSGRHPCGRDEMYERYVSSMTDGETRAKLFTQLEDHAVILGTFVPVDRWWVGGSFVTLSRKPPNDIDCVAIIDGRAHHELESDVLREIDNLTDGPDPWNPRHKVDCLGVIAEAPEGHPVYDSFLQAWGFFDRFLTRETRPGRPRGPKGYLEVTL